MAELLDALKLADRVLDKPYIDPDGDICLLARQFKRAYEANGNLMGALEESVKLQSHYANLLNMHDGGERMQFETAHDWLDRLRVVRSAPSQSR